MILAIYEETEFNIEFDTLINESEEIIQILTSIVKTSRKEY